MPTTSAPFGFLRVAASAPRLRVADPQYNAEQVLEVVREAAGQGVQVLAFPELGLTGYTSGDLFFSVSTLVDGAERALARILQETADSPMVIAVGLPVAQDNLLFNAAAICQSGILRGVVAKSFIPGYKEFYEERWFSPARDAVNAEVSLAGRRVPFGADLLFAREGERALALGVEICEDLWVPMPPSSTHAVAGATVLLNLSASNEVVGKADFRRALVTQQSSRTLSAYVYAGCGVHESTTDVVFGGHLMIAENGTLLGEGVRFRRDSPLLVTDVDVEHLFVERARSTPFGDAVHQLPFRHRRIPLDPLRPPHPHTLVRRVEPHPFVPQEPSTLDARCNEVFSIQTTGLAKRLEHIGIRRVALGLSGGLDSTLALLVAVRTFALLGFDRGGILAISMPAFGTSEKTRGNARRLAEALGVSFREIDIRAACTQHMRDIGLAEGDTGVTYQNVQARERTQVLMDLANKEEALVVGTGDLSEIALGWSTFAGDHISMYNVNCGVPKTLVKELVRWVAAHAATQAESQVLRAILETPVSPELLPLGQDGATTQHTEDILGPYGLHDFFLYCLLRLGAGPAKTLFLARHAFPSAYDEATRRRWMRVFVDRFFGQQFKRSVAADGPKVGTVSLSPRGDWRMPSDASRAAWLAELEEES